MALFDYTFGPWDWAKATQPEFPALVHTHIEGANADDVIATMDFGDDATQNANARLIASAPDLLAALFELLPHAIKDAPMDALERARLAIAKATGHTG